MNGNRCPSAGAKIMVEGVQKTGNHLSTLTGIRESQTIPPTNAAMIMASGWNMNIPRLAR